MDIYERNMKLIGKMILFDNSFLQYDLNLFMNLVRSKDAKLHQAILICTSTRVLMWEDAGIRTAGLTFTLVTSDADSHQHQGTISPRMIDD